MKIEAKIKYQEEYLPTKRHRIPRIREVEEAVEVELREVSRKDAPLSMVVTDYQSYVDENGKDAFGLRDTAFLAVKGQLYTEKRDMWGALDKGPLAMEDFLRSVERYGDSYYSSYGRDKEGTLRSLKEFIDSHVMIDGVLYQQTGEPRYLVQTFGLGHNHGGTSLFVETFYNENIPQERYFSALQREEAIAYANEIAVRRGDTKDVGTFGDINIQVHMPEMVRCNPQMEHGEGNPFLNSVEGLVQGSGSAMEAGLLVMAATQREIEKPQEEKSLEERLEDAALRSNAALEPGTREEELGKG